MASGLAGGRAWLALALAFGLLFAAPALAQPRFPPLTGRVVDAAQVLSPATEQALDADLADLEQRTGRQLVVATVPDLQGYEIEEYGYQLGRAWGVGSKARDDGAVFLVAPTERKVRIEAGYGLEGVLTDALSSVILQSAVLPSFREGRMEEGVVEGTRAIVQQLSLPDDEARARVAQAAERRDSSGSDDVHFIILAIILVLWVMGGLSRAGRRRRGAAAWLLPILLSGSGGGRGRGGGGFGGGFGGGGGFSGGGGSFGGGGSSGSW